MNDVLNQEIVKLKSPLEFKIILSLSMSFVSGEDTLCEKFRRDVKTLRKVAFKLQDRKFIKVLRLKESKNIVYMLDNRFFDLSNSCFSCSFRKKEKTVLGKKNKCTRDGPPCKYLEDLAGLNLIRYIESVSENAFFEDYNRKVNKREYREVDKWVLNDFIDHYIEEFVRRYSSLIPPERNGCKHLMRKIMEVFKLRMKDKNWKRKLRRYIDESDTVTSLFLLSDKSQIRKFCDRF